MKCNASLCPETKIKYYVRTWELDEKGLPIGHIDQAYCKFHKPSQYNVIVYDTLLNVLDRPHKILTPEEVHEIYKND